MNERLGQAGWDEVSSVCSEVSSNLIIFYTAGKAMINTNPSKNSQKPTPKSDSTPWLKSLPMFACPLIKVDQFI